MPDAYLFDAIRTPRGRGKASEASIRSARSTCSPKRCEPCPSATASTPREVDDVVIGCVTQTGDQGACIARFAALEAG